MPIDDFGHLLTPQEMYQLAATEPGRRKLAEYIWRARTAYAAQSVMEALQVTPSAEVQQHVCDLIWDRIFRVSIFEVLDYARQVAEGLEKTDLDCVGNA